ncbi:MAG: GlcG/HbpS family heme-binding protein [Thermodesulfobacteriota bacterium]
MMNLKLAKTILSTAVFKAKEMGKVYSIAVVDENGWLVALHRMDGAPIPTAEMARDKAWTAAVFRMPSSKVSKLGDPKAKGCGFNVQNWNDRLTTIPGGLPIYKENQLIGAIGCCGQTPAKDLSLAQDVLKNIFGEDDDLKSKKRIARKKSGRR